MDEQDPKRPLAGVMEDEIGSALDAAVTAHTRSSPGGAPPPEPPPADPAAPEPTLGALIDPPTQWMLGIDDRQEGPFGIDEIRERVAAGSVNAETLCWKPGLSDWLEIGRTPELAALVAPPPAPAKAPVAAAPVVSVSSLVSGELEVLSRPREAKLPEESVPVESVSDYVRRPSSRSSPAGSEPRPKGVTYALVGGGGVILALAAAVVFLVLRPPDSAAVVRADPVPADAGARLALQSPSPEPIDAGLPTPAVTASPEEPPLSPEELAKLPEKLRAKDIMKVILADREGLSTCVDAQQDADPEVSGKLVMRWDILRSGKSANVQVVSKQFEGSTMASCVTGRIQNWVFPRHRAQGNPVDFPFKF